MRWLLVVLCVATVTATEYSAITRNYHGEIGIPEARRIKLAEASVDFDGARITGGQTSLLGNQPHFVRNMGFTNNFNVAAIKIVDLLKKHIYYLLLQYGVKVK